MAAPAKPALTCPSAQPDMEGASAFGILGGTSDDPRLVYLKRDVVVDETTMRSLVALDPTRVFRFSGRCEEGRCAQFSGGRCSLAGRIVERLQPAVDAPPPCRIRDTCRWHAEEGTAACLRCPQIVTWFQARAPTSRRLHGLVHIRPRVRRARVATSPSIAGLPTL